MYVHIHDEKQDLDLEKKKMCHLNLLRATHEIGLTIIAKVSLA